MKWLVDQFAWIAGIAGAWSLINGILHDIFVLLERRPYERDLIRLLIDGHILIFSGILYLLCCKPLMQGSGLAVWICLANALFVLGYCGLIFKLLPSVVTMAINVVVLIVAVMAL